MTPTNERLKLILQREEEAIARAERTKRMKEDPLSFYNLDKDFKEQCKLQGYDDLADSTAFKWNVTDWSFRSSIPEYEVTTLGEEPMFNARWVVVRDSAIKMYAYFGIAIYLLHYA